MKKKVKIELKKVTRDTLSACLRGPTCSPH